MQGTYPTCAPSGSITGNESPVNDGGVIGLAAGLTAGVVLVIVAVTVKATLAERARAQARREEEARVAEARAATV